VECCEELERAIADKEVILWKNAARLFKLDLGQPATKESRQTANAAAA